MNLKVALVQTELHWEDPNANRRALGKVLEHLGTEPDLVLLPEMFTTGFTMEPQNIPQDEAGITLRWMQRNAEAMDAAIAGSIVWPGPNYYTNRLVFMEPDGSHQYYDKRHTFTLAGEDKVYRKGIHKAIFTFRGFRICPQICYDLRFPVFSRNTEDYDLLFYLANWPHARVEAWDTLLKARAIENMAYVLGVNRLGSDPNGLDYVGHSAGYDSLGNRLVYSEKVETLLLTLKKSHLKETRDSLRFLQDRDPFTPGW